MWTYFNDESISYHKNPFHDAVKNSRLEFVKLLADCGIIKLMLDNAEFKGINVKARDVWNQTAEDLAKLEGHSEVPQLFLKAEAEIELRKFKRKHGIAFPEFKETKGVTKKKK